MRVLALLLAVLLSSPSATSPGEVIIAYLAQARPPVRPVSPLDQEVADESVAGARLGIVDNTTTGRFIGQRF